MNVVSTTIPDVKIIEPRVFEDERGFFMESWNASAFSESGIVSTFVQDNHSHSKRGTLRGLHYQLLMPQAKLVRVVTGTVFDVAVDMRRSSPTFRHWVGVELSAENKRQLWIPVGFAHGFLAISENADLLYKCTEFYRPQDEHCLIWNDADVGIEWPEVGSPPLLSRKDLEGKALCDAKLFA